MRIRRSSLTTSRSVAKLAHHWTLVALRLQIRPQLQAIRRRRVEISCLVAVRKRIEPDTTVAIDQPPNSLATTSACLLQRWHRATTFPATRPSLGSLALRLSSLSVVYEIGFSTLSISPFSAAGSWYRSCGAPNAMRVQTRARPSDPSLLAPPTSTRKVRKRPAPRRSTMITVRPFASVLTVVRFSKLAESLHRADELTIVAEPKSEQQPRTKDVASLPTHLGCCSLHRRGPTDRNYAIKAHTRSVEPVYVANLTKLNQKPPRTQTRLCSLRVGYPFFKPAEMFHRFHDRWRRP